ncbi:MAG: SDR family oxidoreductase [Acidobacteria bacterium]|nr:SDR family oxidoreductase [Acidobacteriota bacterium]
MRLEGKTAIVTGGGRGIGEAISMALAREGCSVAIPDVILPNAEKVAEQIRGLGREALAMHCDITDPQSVENAFVQVDQRWGKLDILVNNAGVAHSDLVVRTPLETWRRMLDVNLTGTFLCSQAALRRMLPRKFGRIISIASVAGQIGVRYAGAYTASKHGVVGLMRTIALETATSGITANAVCPSWVASPILGQALSNISEKTKMTQDQARDNLAAETPQKRIIEPDEIAAAVVWLATDDARGLTGQAISLSCGQVMH